MGGPREYPHHLRTFARRRRPERHTKMIRRFFPTACIVLLCMLVGLLQACDKPSEPLRIGVSQCSSGVWRTKMNNEIQREAAYLGRYRVTICSAEESSAKQCADIDSMVQAGVDLLIVSPNDAHQVTDAIRRARQRGIPIVLVDRMIDSDDYDAFIGADDYEIGYRAGIYAIATLRGHGRVVELMGNHGSTANERHRGFVAALARAPEVKLVDTIEVRWNGPQAYNAVDSLIEWGLLPDFDLAFGHNDHIAMAAHNACEHNNLFGRHYIGVDALAGRNHGVDYVLSRDLDASLLHPTGGDHAMQIADSLLRGFNVKHKTLLDIAIVDSTNAHIVDMQMRQTEADEVKITALNHRLTILSQRQNYQVIMLAACVIIIILVVLIVALVLRAYLTKVKINHELGAQTARLERQKEDLEREKSSLEAHKIRLEEQTEQLRSQTERLGKQRTQLALITDRLDNAKDQRFVTQVREVANAHLHNPKFGVAELAEGMCLSRAQLFRKLKEACDSSPVEFIRAARLKRAAELLNTTDMSIAEICFATGFSSPSYFTRCYKTYFDALPRSFKKMTREPHAAVGADDALIGDETAYEEAPLPPPEPDAPAAPSATPNGEA